MAIVIAIIRIIISIFVAIFGGAIVRAVGNTDKDGNFRGSPGAAQSSPKPRSNTLSRPWPKPLSIGTGLVAAALSAFTLSGGGNGTWTVLNVILGLITGWFTYRFVKKDIRGKNNLAVSGSDSENEPIVNTEEHSSNYSGSALPPPPSERI